MTWMNSRDIGRLDSAICNKRERGSFLSLISGTKFVVRDPLNPDGHEDTRVDKFVTWLLKRHVAATELAATDFFAKSAVERSSYLKRQGTHLRRVVVGKSMKTHGYDIAVRDLCFCCPNVLTFECHAPVTFKTQGIIAAQWTQLTCLALDHCIAREEFVMIGKNCQSLTEVSFQNLRGNAWAVRDFFRFCSPMLQSIFADYSLGPTNFITLGSRCPQLQILRAPEGIVNDAALTALGAGCPRLRALDWNMRDFVTDAGVAAVARNGALTDVDIKMCSNLTDVALRTVAECCSHLECVDIGNCHLLTDATLTAIGRRCPNLRSLCMDETNMTRVGIESIAADLLAPTQSELL
jgi:hypothetical protein